MCALSIVISVTWIRLDHGDFEARLRNPNVKTFEIEPPIPDQDRRSLAEGGKSAGATFTTFNEEAVS
jgi:hypothetical protein